MGLKEARLETFFQSHVASIRVGGGEEGGGGGTRKSSSVL